MKWVKWIPYIIGLLWIILGAIHVLYAEKFQKISHHIISESNPKIFAVIPLPIGILLCVTAFGSQAKWFIFILGLLVCLKALLLLFLPTKQTHKILEWWFTKASDQSIRLWGLILVVLGITLISWI